MTEVKNYTYTHPHTQCVLVSKLVSIFRKGKKPTQRFNKHSHLLYQIKLGKNHERFHAEKSAIQHNIIIFLLPLLPVMQSNFYEQGL